MIAEDIAHLVQQLGAAATPLLVCELAFAFVLLAACFVLWLRERGIHPVEAVRRCFVSLPWSIRVVVVLAVAHLKV